MWWKKLRAYLKEQLSKLATQKLADEAKSLVKEKAMVLIAKKLREKMLKK